MKLFCSVSKYVFFVILFFTFLSCSKDEVEKTKEKSLFLECDKGMTNDIDTVRNHIVGRYDWVYSNILSRAGSFYITPKTENSTISYIFKKNSEVEEYNNGILTNTYIYEINSEILYYGNGKTEQVGSKIEFYDKEGRGRILTKVFHERICNDSANFFIHGSRDVSMQFTRNK